MLRIGSRVRFLAALLALAMFAAACGSSGADTADVAPAEVEDTATETTVAEVVTEEADSAEPVEDAAVEADAPDDELAGASEDENQQVLVDEITALLVDWQTDAGIPGASLSVRLPDRDPVNIAVGVTDLQTGEVVAIDDYFRIGSITKPLTAALVLQLIDEGLIALDEPVETYIPGWLDGHEYAQEITVRQLMDHTNGLIEYAFDPQFYVAAGQRLDQPLESSEIREFLANREPLFAPGTQYSYETGGFLTLGDVIETVTGNTAAEEMRARIFDPSGAENIYLAPQELPPEMVVNGYGRAELYLAGTALVGRQDEAQLTVANVAQEADPVIDVLSQPQAVLQSAGWTGGGAEAQLESVSAVFAALFDGTLLTDAQIVEMTTTVLDANYGLGLDVRDIDGVTHYSHGGGVPGFRSQANYLPDHDIAWAVSANLIPLPEGAGVDSLRAALLPLLLDAAG